MRAKESNPSELSLVQLIDLDAPPPCIGVTDKITEVYPMLLGNPRLRAVCLRMEWDKSPGVRNWQVGRLKENLLMSDGGFNSVVVLPKTEADTESTVHQDGAPLNGTIIKTVGSTIIFDDAVVHPTKNYPFAYATTAIREGSPAYVPALWVPMFWLGKNGADQHGLTAAWHSPWPLETCQRARRQTVIIRCYQPGYPSKFSL